MGFYILLTVVVLLLTSFKSTDATPVDQAKRKNGPGTRIWSRDACPENEAKCYSTECTNQQADGYDSSECQAACQYVWNHCSYE
uniref:Venom peptide Tnr9.2 n=1 Tax=Turris normandavidsoni TaxID=439607 RepID=A0A976LX39_9CAEN|nr:venom peptide precursor Tnr9.2 [Turris normandavidsoni]